MNDNYFMRLAILQAKKAFLKGEVPVGAILVLKNKIIASSHNKIESLRDPTAHAEILCLKDGAKYFNNWRLLKTTLYSTLEPCSMCAGAMILARIERLVWAAEDFRCGANGSWVNILDKKHDIHNIKITKGVLKEQSSNLLKNFFLKVRKVLN